MENTSVLISGAGPTGLTMANLLARMEIPFFQIDKNPRPSRDSKAFGIHARTLEIFDQLGIAEKAIQKGSIENTFHLLFKDKETLEFSMKEVLPGESNFPCFLVLAQDKTEKLLIESLEHQGNKVYWEHELTSLKETDEGVKLTIKYPSGEEKESMFQYVIGCDGAGSTVREQAGFEFEGKTFSSVFYLADCEIDWKFIHGDIYFIFSRAYITGIFSFAEKEKYRVFNFMNPVVNKEKDEDLTSAEVQQILDSNPHFEMKAKNVDWTSVFKIHARYSTSFREGRIFLAGDAAHVHSPAGGQGMNTGIQDAYNLAWKFSLFIKGMAGSRLLDTYHEERYPIARNLHKTTDRVFQLMTSQHILIDFLRLHIIPHVFKVIFRITWFRLKNLRRLSQLSIKYRFSSLSKEGDSNGFYSKAPRPGDRAPYCKIYLNGDETGLFQIFKCTHFIILLAIHAVENIEIQNLSGRLKNNFKIPLYIYSIARSSAGGTFFNTYGIKAEAVFIIRPDGHIGFRSSRVDAGEIENYFRDILKS